MVTYIHSTIDIEANRAFNGALVVECFMDRVLVKQSKPSCKDLPYVVSRMSIDSFTGINFYQSTYDLNMEQAANMLYKV